MRPISRARHPVAKGDQARADGNRASLPWRALLALLRRLPQALISRAVGRVADLPIPRPLRPPVFRLFSRSVGIDLDEVELPLEEYRSLGSFFVRRLRPGIRPWPPDPTQPGSPVDGRCGQLGRIEAGQLVQAKGRWYSCADLLANEVEASRFEGGTFMTIYLSPRDYHRIHAPLGGSIVRARHIPGALLPVNAAAVLEVPDLFPRNERIVCYLETLVGRVALVAVGAINVGRISTSFDPAWSGAPGRGEPTTAKVDNWVTNRPGARDRTHEYTPPIAVERGDEIMAFQLGSTVVLLFEPGAIEVVAGLAAGDIIRLGEPIGTIPAR